MKRKTVVFAALLWLAGCGQVGQTADTLEENSETEMSMEISTEQIGIKQGTETIRQENIVVGQIPEEAAGEKGGEPDILRFVDVFGQEYETEISFYAPKHPYDLDCFLWENGVLSYQGDENYRSRLGVDVSHHQGVIDWQKVKSQGYEFAFLRIGYRGYGTEGRVCPDEMFEQNIREAHAVGLDVGVYFFSQAINEKEALEEAEYVLERLKGYELELPVVYDPESILDAQARTDNVTGEQFTKNTKVFCEEIKKNGYEPMIYSNMLWEAFEFDMDELTEYLVWYADYEPKPQTPYDFCFWQYTNEAKVEGISGNTDLDIQLIKTQ